MSTNEEIELEYLKYLMNRIRKNEANLEAIENRYFEAKEGDSNGST